MNYFLILLGNIHCKSCGTEIKRVLKPWLDRESLRKGEKGYEISVSVPEKMIMVEVGKSTDVNDEDDDTTLLDNLVSALTDSGFQVLETKRVSQLPDLFTSHDSQKVQTLTDLLSTGSDNIKPVGETSLQHSKHLQYCDVCKNHQTSYTSTFSISGMSCSSCVNSIWSAIDSQFPNYFTKSRQSDKPFFTIDLITNSATALFDSENLTTATKFAKEIQTVIYETGFDVEVVEIKPTLASKTKTIEYTLLATIGGMTCASCSNTISQNTLNQSTSENYFQQFNINNNVKIEKATIINTVISLMQHSATFSISLTLDSSSVIKNEESLRQLLIGFVAEKVEDSGYDFDPVSITNSAAESLENSSKTVSLAINGMFCDHCPDMINNIIKSFDSVIINEPISLSRPIIKFTYTPNAPKFTIRSIVDAITTQNATFKPTIVHPLTLEQRSQLLAKKSRHKLISRTLFVFLISIPTFVVGMIGMSPIGMNPDLPPDSFWSKLRSTVGPGSVTLSTWILFALATPVYFYGADTFHGKAIKEVKALWRPGVSYTQRFFRFGSMNLLMSLGASVSYFSSICLLILAARVPPNSHKGQMEVSTMTYFDSVVFLTLFLLIGRLLEAFSKAKTASSVSLLSALKPRIAQLYDQVTHKDTTVSTDLLEYGDYVHILPGMSPPADCLVVSGSSGFDEAALTGESVPVQRIPNDTVFAGTVNVGGHSVIARISSTEGSSMLDQIVAAVREGQLHRAPIERFADTLTSVFVPVITLLAILTWIFWFAAGPKLLNFKLSLSGWALWAAQFAVSVFVVACPCGIGLAAPTALFVGTGVAAKYGILAKGGGEAFQEAANVGVICFDKTGTLTKGGAPVVTDVQRLSSASGLDKDALMVLASELEQYTTHPLGIAVKTHVETNVTKPMSLNVQNVEEVSGRGLRGDFGSDMQVIIGNESFLKESGSVLDPKDFELVHKWKLEGKSVIILAIKQQQQYIPELALAVADQIRDESAAVVKSLQEMGIATWMISGDNQVTAEAVAIKVGIPKKQVIAGVLPQEKAEWIKWLQTQPITQKLYKEYTETDPLLPTQSQLEDQKHTHRTIVAMVGDGVNDAPSLAAADIGIAIGSGSDIAMNSAKFVLLSSSNQPNSYLVSVATLIDLSRVILRRVKFNFGWALVYNVCAVPIAAGVLYPVTHRMLDPVWASLAMAMSSVSVISSSLFLKYYKPGSAVDKLIKRHGQKSG